MKTSLKIILVEDEQIARSKLATLLQEIDPSIEIVGQADSVKQAVQIIREQPEIDLGYFDIQLSDGLSFGIFEQMDIEFPVVFTTAYEQYAIQAFRHHSIGYVLKPIRKSDLEQTLIKYKGYWKPSGSKQLLAALQQLNTNNYKKRFTVKVGPRIKIIETEEISAFYSRFKGTFILTPSGKSYVIDQALDSVLNLINPNLFFRVNRKHVINLSSIQSVVQYSNSRLKIELHSPFDEEVIVARERVKEFKEWLEGLSS
ncbi:MAG: DNA-binding response regulator [Crocinitomicaceae bacterium]|nr:DNA-binding response regulator [Crocinitomicaceae bacterium]|tara:strand:+ start:8981 stop:9751 length:771 start_codon:yes stop_codon:yes gene_type:complete